MRLIAFPQWDKLTSLLRGMARQSAADYAQRKIVRIIPKNGVAHLTNYADAWQGGMSGRMLQRGYFATAAQDLVFGSATAARADRDEILAARNRVVEDEFRVDV